MKSRFLFLLLVSAALLWVGCGDPPPAPEESQPQVQVPLERDPEVPVKAFVVRLAPDGMSFVKEPMELPPGTTVEAQIKVLIEAMGAPGDPALSLPVLPEEARCVEVFFLGNTAVLDMNSTFGEQLGQGARETLDALDGLAAMVQVNFPQIQGVKVLLAGADPGELNGVDLQVPILFRGQWAETPGP